MAVATTGHSSAAPTRVCGSPSRARPHRREGRISTAPTETRNTPAFAGQCGSVIAWAADDRSSSDPVARAAFGETRASTRKQSRLPGRDSLGGVLLVSDGVSSVVFAYFYPQVPWANTDVRPGAEA